MEKHADKYRQLAINIAYYRKKANIKVGISRTHMSNIEAPNVLTAFTTTVLFDIADALGVELIQLFDFTK